MKNRLLRIMKELLPRNDDVIRNQLVRHQVFLHLRVSFGDVGTDSSLASFWGTSLELWYHIARMSLSPYEPRLQLMHHEMSDAERASANAMENEVALKATR